MELKKIKTILIWIVAISFIIAILLLAIGNLIHSSTYGYAIRSSAMKSLDIPYTIFTFVVPVIVFILMSLLLFSSNWFRKIWEGDNLLKKIFSIIGNVIIVCLTAYISFIILAIIGVFSGISIVNP